MMLTVISPPGEAALPLAEAKAFLRIGHDGEDTLVADLTDGATVRLEEATGLALVSRTLRASWTHWPSALSRRGIALRPGPVTALSGIRILDAEGDESDVTGRFGLEAGRLCLKPVNWAPAIPAGGRAEADFEAGFGTAADVPGDLVQALKLILLEAYRRNGDVALPEEARAIIAARREVRL
ncbi:head-tail connector protein [Henriciella aquimarina]|uniref:head-tail connector protein n=1 Tax=Henriciella aquimarina TaxID=545261 RepID=UPI0009FF5574|nr:hypothetical protein [Henriciella aquimarina]